MMRRYRIACAAGAALFAAGCFETMAGGSGTGTGNSVTAALAFANGAPAARVSVRIRPADYYKAPPNPALRKASAFTLDGTTDSAGVFRADSLPPGAYVLEANDARVGVVWRFQKVAKLAQDRADTLRPVGTVTGGLHLSGELAGPAYIQVAGLERAVAVGAGGAFAIRDLPPGDYDLRAVFSPGDSAAIGTASVSIRSGDTAKAEITLAAPFPNWKHAAVLRLNTTASGAGVARTVTDIPLLVRLRAPAFAFSEAGRDGDDLRFAKEDGTPLRYEIERWDSAAGLAEVWVAADTVLGNSAAQKLRMYWGNIHALAASSGPGVFDTAKGYRAVWHLGEAQDGAGEPDLYRDATGNSNHGLDSVLANGKDGLIGLGQEFNGAGDYIHIPQHVIGLAKETHSLSLWFRIQGPGGTLLGQFDPDGDWSPGESSLYFGDGTWITGSDGGGQCRDGRVAPGRCVNGLVPSFVGFNRGYLVADKAVGADAWHRLDLTWGGAGTGKFYLDGSPMGMAENRMAAAPADSAGYDLYLGKPNGLESIAYFKGWLDEVRISAGVRDADWIRLSFENQRSDSRLIEISSL